MGCTFCAIPQFRGSHRSRPLADIVAEVEGLARRGIQEAILVSQDTLAYGRDLPGNGDIGDLLLALVGHAMPWIRPMYLHPAHVNDRLVGEVGARPRGAVPRHARAARRRRRPARDAPRRHRAAHEGDRRASSARPSPASPCAPPCSSGFPGETRRGLRDAPGFRRGGARSTGSASSPTRRRRARRAAAHARPGARGGHGRARARWCRSRRTASPGSGRRALAGTAADVLVDGPSEDPAFPVRGPDGRARRRRSTASSTCATAALTPGHFARVRIVEVDGYELVGERA